jgi:putative acetyltransferase
MPTAPVRIVEAETPGEIDAARRLFGDYAASLGWSANAEAWMAEEIAGLPGPYASPRGSLLVAYIDDRPAGAVGLQPVPADVLIPGVGAETAGELKRLFVREELRRRGVGRGLMERVEIEALGRGYDSLVLTTSPEMMPLAQSMYDSLGYVETTPYRNDMPWPGIRWMRKVLRCAATDV